MKDDVEIPASVPHKRRQVEQLLDKWIALWLAGDEITPSERRRLEGEKQRRKDSVPDHLVGLIVPQEGLTPSQLARIIELMRASGATKILHTRMPRKAHGALMAVCRELGLGHELVAVVRDEMNAARIVVHDVHEIVAAVKEREVQTYATPGVWSMVGLARHRGVPARVVFPDGHLQQGDGDGSSN